MQIDTSQFPEPVEGTFSGTNRKTNNEIVVKTNTTSTSQNKWRAQLCWKVLITNMKMHRKKPYKTCPNHEKKHSEILVFI